jgi:hypothetical protein
MLNPGTDCRLTCLREGMHYSTLLKEMVRVPGEFDARLRSNRSHPTRHTRSRGKPVHERERDRTSYSKGETHGLLRSLVSWRGATEIVRVASIVAENRQKATLFAESRAHLKWLVLFQSSCRFITAS